MLLVDAAQGVEAQTLANAYLAIENGLEIIPVVNKIDLPSADPDRVAAELIGIVGGSEDDVIRVSAKSGMGVEDLLEAIVAKLPAPAGEPEAPLRAMVFDSYYDTYRGVVCSVRVVDGRLVTGQQLRFMATDLAEVADEIGILAPRATPVKLWRPAMLATWSPGSKRSILMRVGDTVTSSVEPSGSGSSRLRGAEAHGLLGAVSRRR